MILKIGVKEKQKKVKILKKKYHQKSMSICYYVKSVFEQTLPDNCHEFLGKVRREWFVREMEELESELYQQLETEIE